ncbi:protein with role in RNA processing [Aspergillus tubingensis]|nr:protein with role in RNA processing [Aspergillus tubingensis]
MADNKRHSVGARTSAQGSSGATAGQGMAGAMVPLEVALSRAIGARVRISTSPVASTIEGTLFTACPITNLVAINTAEEGKSQTGDYHVIPVSRIQSFQILSLSPSNTDGASFSDAVPPLHALDIRALKAREAAAVGKLQEGEARRGKGVTKEAQDLFDAFSRTMPARWDGSKIIVADAVSIAAPYRPDDCRPLVAGDTAALARVRMVLEMERKKIELRNASATIGAGAAGQRKGG